VFSRLNKIEGFQCKLSKGAFYAFVNIRDFGASSEQFAEYLVNKAGVITMPGSAFEKHGEDYLRLSYATAYNQLEEALDRIENAAKRFKKA